MEEKKKCTRPGCHKEYLESEVPETQKPGNRIILLHSSEKKINSENLNKAIFCFKKVILLYNSKNELSSTEASNIEGILNLIFKSNKKSVGNLIDKSNSDKGIMINMIFSVYLNLLFALSITNKYTEILFLISSCFKKIIPMNEEFKGKLIMFKIEALLALGKLDEASECITENLEQENFKLDLYNKKSGAVINDFCFRINLYISNIFLCCKKKKFLEAEVLLRKLILNFFKNREVPNFIFNIAIYIFCSQGKSGINKTIKLIKKRTFDFLLNNSNYIS